MHKKIDQTMLDVVAGMFEDMAFVFVMPDEDGAVQARLADSYAAAVVRNPHPPAGTHVIDHLLGALPGLGIRPARSYPRLRCRAEWLGRARETIGPKSQYAVVHPGSGGREKLWPLSSWAAVLDALPHERIIVTCGPADAEPAGELISELNRRGRRCVLLEGRPLTTMAGVLAEAALYLGCDSGMTHLAAALGRPTVAVFGPTDPATWAPRGPRVRVVAGPDRTTGSVSPDDALRAVERLRATRPGETLDPTGGTR
jgi:ADP-heptose:LPS heptosyltransferase